MRGVKIIVAAGLLAVASFGLAACSSDSDSSSSSSDTKASTTTTTAKCDNTIVDTAAGNPDFSTLVSAVQQADLVDTLNAEGPYTVFAPTNAAFAKIDAATLQGILADKEQLTKILTYHVLDSKVKSSDLQPTQTVATVEGSDVTITADASGAKINDANITTTDIETCNGVIHVIDTVLVPPDA